MSKLATHIHGEFHNIITDVEDAYEKKQFISLADRFFDMVEECAPDRPVGIIS